jgi:hypothetical protein
VLAPNIEQKLAQLRRELLREAAVTARLGVEAGEAVFAIGIEPSLERGQRIGARAVRARGRNRCSLKARSSAASWPCESSRCMSGPTSVARKIATASA